MEHDEHIELLETICAIDSRTIEGAEGTVRVAEILGERLETMGFDLDWVDTIPGEQSRGRHLVAVRNPAAPVRLVLLGHTDTVLSPTDTPFAIDLASGQVRGAGTCDMKGGCVVMLEAIRAALEEDPVREAGLLVLLDCCEERSDASFAELLRRKGQGAAACLNFEPAVLGPNGEHQFAVARKGVVSFRLVCHGRAAHSGNDHEVGVNAIREVARKIEQIELLTDYDRELTANVGVVSGGRVANQVAEGASAAFDVRAFDADVLNSACEKAHRICSESTVRSAADGVSTRLELEERRPYPPWPQNSWTDALARRYVELARKRDVVAVPVRRGGGADASHMVDLAPTLDGLGVIGGGLHSTREWADVKTLALRAQIAADLVIDICSDPPAATN